jgi:hypothetical protein
MTAGPVIRPRFVLIGGRQSAYALRFLEYFVSGILMFMFAGRMLNGQNDDLLARFVNGVIDQIRVFPGDELPYALNGLRSAHVWKEHQILKRLKNGGAHMLCGVGLRA